MRRLPLLVVASVLLVVTLAVAGVALSVRSTSSGPALTPITVQPQGPTAQPTPPGPVDPGGTVPPPPARDAQAPDDELDDDFDDLDDDPDDDDDD